MPVFEPQPTTSTLAMFLLKRWDFARAVKVIRDRNQPGRHDDYLIEWHEAEHTKRNSTIRITVDATFAEDQWRKHVIVA